MTTTEFKNEWIGFSTPEIEEQFDIDLNALINDEIERRMELITAPVIRDYYQGNNLDYVDGCVDGAYFLKSKLLKPKQ